MKFCYYKLRIRRNLVGADMVLMEYFILSSWANWQVALELQCFGRWKSRSSVYSSAELPFEWTSSRWSGSAERLQGPATGVAIRPRNGPRRSIFFHRRATPWNYRIHSRAPTHDLTSTRERNHWSQHSSDNRIHISRSDHCCPNLVPSPSLNHQTQSNQVPRIPAWHLQTRLPRNPYPPRPETPHRRSHNRAQINEMAGDTNSRRNWLWKGVTKWYSRSGKGRWSCG